MKIVVQESGGKTLKLVFPTGMIFNPVTAVIASSIINKTLDGKLSEEDLAEAEELAESANQTKHPAEMFHISTRDMIRFCHEINRMKRIHGNLPLVEVEDDGGDCVNIWL